MAAKKSTKQSPKRQTPTPTPAPAPKRNLFIFTVTNYYTGELVSMGAREIVLRNAAWIADTGRFAEFLKTGNADEVEPYPDGMKVHINAGGLIDYVDWPHALPRVQK